MYTLAGIAALGLALLFLFVAVIGFYVAYRIWVYDPVDYEANRSLTKSVSDVLRGTIAATRASAAEGRTSGGYEITAEGKFIPQHKISDREIDRMLGVQR